MSRRTPPVRITEAELRALRWCVDHCDYDPGISVDQQTIDRARRALDKLSGLPTKKQGEN